MHDLGKLKTVYVCIHLIKRVAFTCRVLLPLSLGIICDVKY